MTDAEPTVIRQCEICGKDRILFTATLHSGDGVTEQAMGQEDRARCDCGESALDDADIQALQGRGP